MTDKPNTERTLPNPLTKFSTTAVRSQLRLAGKKGNAADQLISALTVGRNSGYTFTFYRVVTENNKSVEEWIAARPDGENVGVLVNDVFDARTVAQTSEAMHENASFTCAMANAFSMLVHRPLKPEDPRKKLHSELRIGRMRLEGDARRHHNRIVNALKWARSSLDAAEGNETHGERMGGSDLRTLTDKGAELSASAEALESLDLAMTILKGVAEAAGFTWEELQRD